MHLDDALRIVSRLKNAFPVMALDEGQSEVLVKELALLHDAEILDAAVEVIIQREDKFPTIARIRSSYRAVAESHASVRAALERESVTAGDSTVPIWVQVWSWHRERTQAARMEANPQNAGKRAEDRLPVRMREFPQFPQPLAPDALTMQEYDELREAWTQAGCPGVRSAADLVASVL